MLLLASPPPSLPFAARPFEAPRSPTATGGRGPPRQDGCCRRCRPGAACGPRGRGCRRGRLVVRGRPAQRRSALATHPRLCTPRNYHLRYVPSPISPPALREARSVLRPAANPATPPSPSAAAPVTKSRGRARPALPSPAGAPRAGTFPHPSSPPRNGERCHVLPPPRPCAALPRLRVPAGSGRTVKSAAPSEAPARCSAPVSAPGIGGPCGGPSCGGAAPRLQEPRRRCPAARRCCCFEWVPWRGLYAARFLARLCSPFSGFEMLQSGTCF